jgi:GT2 family glycosyltransferase
MANKLTVIIPSRNNENLAACLVSIRMQDRSLDAIVVDDGLGYQTAGTIPGAKPFVFARNINIGIAAAQPSDVILLNDDAMLVTPGGFTAMQAIALHDPFFGIVSAAVVGPSNSPEHAPRAALALRPILGFTIPFVCVFIPRTTLDEIGLLDERFKCYGGDDDDYCYRVRSAGLQVGLYDGCVVDHKSLKSTFRPDGRGLPISDAQRIFREIHGFEMATR